MVLLPRKRPPPPSSTSASAPPPKLLKSTDQVDKMLAILAEAGCTLINPSGPPCLPSPPHHLRSHLHRLFSSSENAAALRSDFIAGLSAYLQSPRNLRRVLATPSCDGTRSESLVRHLLLVPPIQLDLQNLLLQKLPEFFHADSQFSGTPLSLEDDVARLIINQFRWLDFIADPAAFADNLMQVLSICPLHLKREIIGSLPEIIGDQNNKTVVDSLEQMLREDSSIIVPVLDAFSNLNLDESLQEQVITTVLTCIRTVDAEHLPYLLRFLLLSATPTNVRRIIAQIRQQIKFVGISSTLASQHNKFKGKSVMCNTEASIIDALRSSLLFKNMLCQEILKELNSIDKPEDHKVIDIWLLLLIYMNGESMKKRVEKVIKKKIVDKCIPEVMIDQCISGNKDLVQLSLFDNLHIRQGNLIQPLWQVLGALVTHVGSGVSSEVNSALDTIALLSSKYARELIPLSTHINGILDYLEGFDIENLHKVYEVFSQLARLSRSSDGCFGSSIASELLMIIRKQVSHSDFKYKKMGLIGTLKIVSCLGDESNASDTSSSQKSNFEEALELLRTTVDSCKQLCLPMVLFYDELSAMLYHKKLHPEILEWVGKHVGEFESRFLSDLEGGQLTTKDLFCGLEGELWMNLDGDISPVCLSILPLACSSLQSNSPLQILPANFSLLSAVERSTNKGSLGGIDALLGCPLHLPSSKYFFSPGWLSLTVKQKQIACLSLYYAINWIRELLNAFCTQVSGRFECTSQATKEDIIVKLLKRLRNLVFLESLLNYCIRSHHISLPDLHLQVEHSGALVSNSVNDMVHASKRNAHKKTNEKNSPKKKKHKKAASSLEANGKLRQPTIVDVFRKAGAIRSQELSLGDPSTHSSLQGLDSAGGGTLKPKESVVIEIASVAKDIESQRFKFRPLMIQSLILLTLSKKQNSCCSDPSAELPLYLYLLRDLHSKLDYFGPSGKQSSAKCYSVPPGDENCEEHWKGNSASAGNPDVADIVLSKSAVSTMVFKEVLHCFSKMMNLPDIEMHKPVFSDLLQALQPSNISENVCSNSLRSPSPVTIDCLYLGAASFLENAFDIACSFSFMLAAEALLALESVVTSTQIFLDKFEKSAKTGDAVQIHLIIPKLRSRLGTSAQKLLRHNWNAENLETGWKNKGEVVQKIVRIYLQNSEAKSDLLDELACSILPQVSSSRSSSEDVDHGFPTLCNATFVVWYRTLHEVNLSILNKLVKEVVHSAKSRAGSDPASIEKNLIQIQKSVDVVVSLVNICRTYDKVNVHAMAVNYGGKFVDTFLKAFDFLQAHFQAYKELIIQLVKELQKATRTIQTLCSEAKGLKQTAITSKIPAAKRSMERYLFRVKALLHATSSGCTFWMGNLKHKDLAGQVVSSQVYVEDQNDNAEEDLAESADEDQSVRDSTAVRETEEEEE
ncbi:hypothetical protein Tsubulata_040599 [Turnera subulata]|uniref:Fanconi anemia group D2 protein homolog n=1 Tax=Turnera subulata TaxID=218843 RepID=A0A9Q0F3D1_9ROSI|nr:hypothetical protein Tsubulata_040599 [Turnera subulata]